MTIDLDPLATSTARLLVTVETLAEDAVRRPSLLPDWSIGHVLTHLARNADGNRRMIEGAARGEVLDQYPHGREGRAADIESGARRPGAVILEDVRSSAESLAAALDAMPGDAWDRPVRTFAGEYAAALVPVARRREVEVHHADLGLAYTPADWPPDLVAAELATAASGLAARVPKGTHLRLRPAGLPELTAGQGDEIVVAGAGGWMLAWLFGRPIPDTALDAPSGLPSLGPWQ